MYEFLDSWGLINVGTPRALPPAEQLPADFLAAGEAGPGPATSGAAAAAAGGQAGGSGTGAGLPRLLYEFSPVGAAEAAAAATWMVQAGQGRAADVVRQHK